MSNPSVLFDPRLTKSPATRFDPIRLGWCHFAFVSAGLLCTLAVLWVYSPYEWQELYYRDSVIPRLQARYGFRLGDVSAFRDGSLLYQSRGVVEVSPDGEFARIGVRAGDAPFEYHGNGFTMMHHALVTAERGGFAAFDVVNVHELTAGQNGGRTIPVYPRVREVPASLAGHKDLPSPTGRLTLLNVESPVNTSFRELWLRDSVLDRRKKLWDFRDSPWATASWSADGAWLAANDSDWDSQRCVLVDVSREQALDLTDMLMSLPAHARPSSSDRLECEIFGWVQDRPTRIALIFRYPAVKEGERWIYDFFFDVTTRQFIAAGR